MLASPALPFVLSFAAGVAVTAIPSLFHLNAVRRQRDASDATARLLRISLRSLRERNLTVEAKLDAIHNQHVEAGKRSHRAEKARCAETTRALALSIGRPDLAERINDPLDDTGRGVAPVSTSARAGFGSSAPLSNSCGGSAAPKADESGGTLPVEPTGRGAVPSRRRPSGSRPGIRPAKPAGETARLILPAEIPQTKGA